MEYIKAFAVGGFICIVGQVILDNTKLTPAHILVTFLILGVIMGAIGIYEPILEFGGAGASIPICGFGNSLAKGAIEGAKSKGLIGAFTGGIEATAAGVSGIILFGYIMAILFDPKTKK